MKKRALAVMLAGVMVLGAQTGVWAASDTSDQKEGELTLLMVNDWIDETGAKGEEFTKVIKQYEEENPGVEITLQGASQQDIKESFQTVALAGGGADIVMMDNSGHAIDLAAMGLLYPLEDITTADELTAQYQEGPLNSGKFEGKYYSVPWYMDCTGLYYNKERLEELLDILKLKGREKHLPNQLSGGQQQRVSIGRALMNSPAVVLADEPTGNLDSKNSQEIVDLLKLSNKKYDQTLIVITHDENIALQADRIIAIEDGRITRDEVIRR